MMVEYEFARKVSRHRGNNILVLAWLLGVLVFSLGFPEVVHAEMSLDEWRSEARRIRLLAENDSPRAYEKAQQLEAKLPAEATPVDRAQLLNLQARIETYLALTEPAATHAQQAFDLATQHGDLVGQAEADLNIALNAINQGKIDAMVTAVTHSMTILDGVDRQDLLVEAMLWTAMMYGRQGLIDDSVTMALQALEIAQRSNNSIALAYAHKGVALSFEQTDNLEDARKHYLWMRQEARNANMRHLEAEAILGLGSMVGRQGDWPAGERLIREAIDIFRQIGHPFSVALGKYALAENLGSQGDTAAVVPLLDEAVAIYEKYPNKIGLWWTLNARSAHYQLLGKISLSEADAERAYRLAREIGVPLYLSESAKRLASIAAVSGDHRLAYELSIEADEMSVKAARKNTSKRMRELIQRYETDSAQRQIAELNRHSDQQATEIQHRKLRQRWLWTMLSASLIILAGTAIFLVRLRSSHRQLQQYQSNQQAILEAIPDMLFELGLDGRYYSYYSSCTDLLVAPASDLLGKTICEVLPPDVVEICLSALQEAHENGLSTGREYALSLPQGLRWFEISIARKAMRKGEEPRFIGLARDITDRKVLEARLSEREREFRTLAENAPDNIARYDLQCRMRYVNPQFEKTVGMCAQELLGKTPRESKPDIEDTYQAKIEAVLKTGQANEIELTLPDTGEGLRYHHIRFVAERGANGKIIGVLAIGRDISEQRRAERLLVNLANSIPGVLGAYRVRADGSAHQAYASPGLYDIFGVDFEEIKDDSRPRLERIHPDDFLPAMQEMADATRTMTPGRNEYRVNHPIKGEIWVETHATPVREDDGSIIWYGYSADVTERHRLQDALAEREREFRTLAEHSPDVVARLDSSCRYMYCNPLLLETIGWAQEEILGKTPLEIRNDEVIMRFQKKVEEVVRTGLEAELIHIVPTRGTRKIHDHVRFTPEFDASGRVISVLVIGRDISELKEVERQLRTLVDNLPDFVMRLDAEGRYLYLSPAVSKAFDLPVEHFIGKTAVETAITGDMIGDLEFLDSALSCAREGIPTMLVTTFRHTSGNRVFDIMHVPERDEFGHIESVLCVARDITSLQTAHQDLKKKERLLRSLIDSIPDMIFIKNVDSIYLGFNKAFSEYCGQSEEQLVGKTDYAYALPADADFFRQKDQQMLANGYTIHYDEWVVYPGGHQVLLDTMKTPLYDLDGRIIGIIGISRDITARHRMEQELIRREREFRTLAENSPNILVRYDRECRRVYLNQAYKESMGLVGANLLGRTPQECWWMASPTAEEYMERLRNTLEAGEPDEFLMEKTDQEGLPVYYSWSLAPEFDGEGKVANVLAIGHDITDIKRMEALLGKSEREFRTLAEHSPEMIVRYDLDCRRIYINPAYVHEMGISLDKARNKTPDEVWKPLMPSEEYMSRLKRVMKTGKPDRILLEWYGLEGNLVSHIMHAVAEYDEQDIVVGALVIGHNISEIKATERLLEESQHLLRELAARSEAAREDERKYLTREIHDELGQYLMALRMGVSVVGLQFGEDNSALKEQIDRIIEVVDSTIHVVRNVVASLRPKVLDMGVVPALEWLVDEHQKRSETACELHVSDENIQLDDARATAVFRIVQESLTNIGRHANASKVDVMLKQSEDQYVLQIRDNGKGFDPVVRKDKSFGLVGMQERALMLGGKVEVSSMLGQGTEIKLYIPVNDLWSNESEDDSNIDCR